MNNYGKILKRLTPLFTVGVIIVFYTVSAVIVNNEYILPSFHGILSAFIGLFVKKAFYLAFLSTFLRSLIAFIISFVIAFVLSWLSFKYDTAKRIISVLISLTRALPTIAVVLLLLLWTNSDIAPVIVTMLVVLPTVYSSLYSGFNSVDDGVKNMLKTFGISKKDSIVKVYIPTVLPVCLKTVGDGLSLNIKLMVAAEVLSSTANSLGYMLSSAKSYFMVAEMFALVVVSLLTGVIIELVFDKISTRRHK